MFLISVICVSNDKKVLNDYLMKSLDSQQAEYELIVVDNSTGRFTSAASALNWGALDAKGDFLMFVHQDFDFESSEWLTKCERLCAGTENLGAAGAAGKGEGRGIVSNIKDRWPEPKRVGNTDVDAMTKVQTLDECLIVIPRNVFARFRFDEKTCDNWHLYAVDISLTLLENGLGVYVLPLPGYHRSNNKSLRSGDYFETMKRVLRKHEGSFAKVYTTCGTWSGRMPFFVQRMRLMILLGLLKYEEG
ncbi:MAG: glycosyltransferase family 2 protein [Methanomassiliicoccales archaeon]|nr:glycosyltransferase family 2 protein [Methanomassiliicoccales archaeon]